MFIKSIQTSPGYILFIIALFVLAAPSIGTTDEIKLYLDDTRTEHIMVEQQDCSVHKGEDGGVTLGFKLGGLFFGIGPEISFGKKPGIDWDHTVQGLIARYQELCARLNTGGISKAEYEKRLAEIEDIEKEAYDLHQEFLRKKAEQRQELFDELENETRGTDFHKKAHNGLGTHDS
jgi:chaperonin cofactor prefoldin|tara:strand:- start:214 stop:741 length:528 start_codon:yes stop_codon:yes gene_type:complete